MSGDREAHGKTHLLSVSANLSWLHWVSSLSREHNSPSQSTTNTHFIYFSQSTGKHVFERLTKTREPRGKPRAHGENMLRNFTQPVTSAPDQTQDPEAVSWSCCATVRAKEFLKKCYFCFVLSFCKICFIL